MTTWVEFHRVLCRHRQGYRMTLDYEAAANHPGQDSLPRVLFMVPLPEGDANGRTLLAGEWIAGEGETA